MSRPVPAPTPDVSFEGGDLDCGSGLLLMIRSHIDPLPRGGLLEILSTETSVREDLPAWCRLTGNELVASEGRGGGATAFLVCKGKLAERSASSAARPGPHPAGPVPVAVSFREHLPAPAAAAPLPPLSVMGLGSWPRPRWMVQAVHERLEGRLAEEDFETTADDAVRLSVEGQRRAGVDVFTDGEQRRDSYASFVAARLDNCQLIPLTDLLPLVDDPEAFQEELRALDVPAAEVRHPAVFGRLGRSRPLVLHEARFVQDLVGGGPVKIALPGPYLLTRTMWMECISDRAYASREDIAADIVRVLREELADLLAAGVSLVQFDEPVLSEVVFTAPSTRRSFMCGALSEKGDAATELAFARDLVNAVTDGFPLDRIGLHMCRGNWTPDESTCLSGDYSALVPTLAQMRVGTYLLELCTPRAGEMALLRGLPEDRRIGVGVVNQKHARVETVEEITAQAGRAIDLFGARRVLLHPDCGFATFADNPVTSTRIAEAKLSAIAEAAAGLRRLHRLGTES
jgi:5-methyltetrahydropteroyltriglutamate--homocysteine methyltransferase